MGDVIDIARLQAARMGSDGMLFVEPVNNGTHIQLRIDAGEHEALISMTLEDAQRFVETLQHHIFSAKEICSNAYGLVYLAWCDTKGEPLSENVVRGRIARRVQVIDAAGVEVAIEPEKWQREPRHGWPQDGPYRLDGWPMARDPRRRGWRIVRGLPTDERDGAK